MPTPVIDIFAGPGGLGEGFSSLVDDDSRKLFRIALSIEMDQRAHKTLTLRSFFRQFDSNNIPNDYYDFIQGKITLEKLYENWPKESTAAKEEAWCARLGKVPDKYVDEKIDNALKGRKNWLLIGGPPCQAYSLGN